MECCFREQVLLNDIFAELDGIIGIKKIISYTDRSNINGLQVDDIAISKNYGRKYEKLYQRSKSNFK